MDYADTLGHHKALSLGHTLANYLELRHGLRHGPAVFYGIIFETLLSYELKVIDKKRFKKIMQTMVLFENKIRLLKSVQKKIKIVDAIKKLKFDKINHGKFYTFILLTNDSFCVKKDIEVETLVKVFNQFKKMEL